MLVGSSSTSTTLYLGVAMPPNAPESPAADAIYPALESFIEKGALEEVASLFEPAKAELKALTGPKAEAGKKAAAGIEKAEELLKYLLEVRATVEKDKKIPGR